MGNYISCALTGAHPMSTIQIILPDSNFRHVRSGAGASAADLMFDFPGHFLVNSRSLRIGTRFSPLSADEDLEPGNVYVMFPMRRVNSVVTAADMGPLVFAAGKAVRRASGGRARVLPEYSLVQTLRQAEAADEQLQTPRVKVDDDVEDESVSEFRGRLSQCRSRRPRLETITEEGNACS